MRGCVHITLRSVWTPVDVYHERADFSFQGKWLLSCVRSWSELSERDTIYSGGGQRGRSAHRQGRDRETLCALGLNPQVRETAIELKKATEMELGQACVHLPLIILALTAGSAY